MNLKQTVRVFYNLHRMSMIVSNGLKRGNFAMTVRKCFKMANPKAIERV